MSNNFASGMTPTPVLDENFQLLGIKLVGTEYVFDVRGDLQTVDGPNGEPEVVGGIVHSGQIYTVVNGQETLLLNGLNSFELPATFFGSILEAFGVFDGADVSKNYEMQRFEVMGLPAGTEPKDLRLELKTSDDSSVVIATGTAAGFKLDGNFIVLPMQMLGCNRE